MASRVAIWLSCVLLLLLAAAATSQGLEYGFYSSSCPEAEVIVRRYIPQNSTVGARLIAMAFGRQQEYMSMSPAVSPAGPIATGWGLTIDNEVSGDTEDSLRALEMIDMVQVSVELDCPGVVSCADIVQYAVHDASFFLSIGNRTFAILPPPVFNLSTLIIDSLTAQGIPICR